MTLARTATVVITVIVLVALVVVWVNVLRTRRRYGLTMPLLPVLKVNTVLLGGWAALSLLDLGPLWIRAALVGTVVLVVLVTVAVNVRRRRQAAAVAAEVLKRRLADRGTGRENGQRRGAPEPSEP